MIRHLLKTVAVVGAMAVGLALAYQPPVASMPRLMDQYNAHPLSRPKYHDKCVICHVRADGSGSLSPFGEAYERAGLSFTPALIKAYLNLFASGGAVDPATAAPSASASSAPAAPVVPGNEPFDAAVYYKRECVKCHGKYGDGDPLQAVPAFATKKWIDERSGKTDELLLMILKGKDKMVGQEGKINEEQARQLLDLIRGIAIQYS